MKTLTISAVYKIKLKPDHLEKATIENQLLYITEFRIKSICIYISQFQMDN